MAGEGFKLVITKEELKRIENADKNIENLGITAEQTRDKVIKAFNDMIKNGVNPFRDSLKQAKTEFVELKTADLIFKKLEEAIKKTGDTTKKTSDDVGELVDRFAKLKQETNFDPKAGLETMNLGKTKEEIKEIRALLSDPKLNLGSGQEGAENENFLKRRLELLKQREKQAVKSEETILAEREKADKKASEVAEREAQKRERIAQKEAKEREKEAKETARIIAQAEKERNTSYSGALSFSKRADSINKERQAIQNLTIARDNLSKSDKNYDKKVAELNKRILQHKVNIDNATSAANRLEKAHNGLFKMLGPLGNKMAAVFSVAAISGYVKQMINVRAEFELQNRALQAILQNKDQADALFDRITQLAVRSPYRVKELVTYTKQLAAYRVEEEKLYDTTKMLADVSSGLGVDMQRLILAYGQVKAANYLRGQELRQFSEAGINILGELAQYFSELEGRAISTGEIFERVSKRMVAFEDVAEVFKRITEEGGIFYNMQEIQAETLKGQISNLRDSIDIMFNEMGKGNEGVLKNSVALIRSIVENWETLARALKIGAVVFLAYAANAYIAAQRNGLFEKSVIKATIAEGGFNATLAKTAKGLKAFAASGGPIALAILAVSLLISKIAQNRLEMKRYNEEFEESAKKMARSKEAIKQYTPELAALAKEQKALTAEHKDDEETQRKLADIREKQKKLLGELAEADASYANSIRGRLNDEQALIQAARDYNAELEARLRLEGKLNPLLGANTFWGAIFGTKKLSEAYDEASTNYMTETKAVLGEWEHLVEIIQQVNLTPYTDIDKAITDAFLANDGKTKLQKINDLWARWNELSVSKQKYIRLNVPSLVDYNVARQDFEEIEDVAVENLKQALFDTAQENYIADLYGKFLNVDDLKEKAESKDLIIDFFNKQFDESNITPAMRKKAEEYLLSIFAFGKWEKTSNLGLSFLQQQMADYIKRNQLNDTSIFPKINESTDTDNYFKELGNRYKELTEAAIRAREAKERLDKDLTNEQLAQKYESQAASVRAFREAFGYFDDSKQSQQLSLLKQRIQLLQDMYRKYMELRKNFSDTTAKKNVEDSYLAEFNDLFSQLGWNIKNFDFTTLEGVLKQLGKLDTTAKRIGKNAVRELDKAKGDTSVQIGVKIAEDDREQLERDINDMFDGYEMSLELDKLDIPAELGQQLFGVTASTMAQMNNLVQQWMREGRFVGEEGEKLYKNTLEKIADMEDKADKERLKKYLGMLTEATEERINIKKKELLELRAIDKMENVSDHEKYLMREKVKENARKELDNQAWKEFKDSDLYIQLFEDLDKASIRSLTVMREQLEEMRTSLNDLDTQSIKEIAKQIDKIDEVMHNRHPLRYLNDDLKESVNYLSNKKTWEQSLEDAMRRAAYLTERRNEAADLAAKWWEKYQNFSEKGMADEAKNAYFWWEKWRKETETHADALKDTNDEIDIYTRRLSKGQRAMQNMGNTLVQTIEWMKEVNSLMEEFALLSMETWGTANDSAEAYARIIGQTAEDVANLAQSVVKLIASEGSDIQSWINAGKAIAGIWRDYNDFVDQGKIDIIEKQQIAIDNLAWAYSRLEKEMDNVLLLEEALVTGDQMLQNIQMRREAIEAQLAAEEERKNPDESAITKYKQQLIELEDELDAAKSKMLEAFGGIGNSNYASEAANIVSAWVDAYKNGENTLDAINGKFDEFIDNLIKKQAALRYANRYIERLFEDFDSMFDESGVVNHSDLEAFKVKKDEAVKQIDAGLREIMETLGFNQGYANSGLTSLQKGIQGVTEKEAEVIESYLNGVRANQMTINTNIDRIYTWLNNVNNPILEELRRTSGYVKSIRDDIRDMMTSDSVRGKGLKVFMQ